jgi:hypothetical protein
VHWLPHERTVELLLKSCCVVDVAERIAMDKAVELLKSEDFTSTTRQSIIHSDGQMATPPAASLRSTVHSPRSTVPAGEDAGFKIHIHALTIDVGMHCRL